MAVFTYMARDEAGEVSQGDVTALDRDEAVRVIRSEGKFVVRVERKGDAAASSPKTRTGTKGAAASGSRFKPDDLIFFTNQLAVMAETGVSLAEALDACVHDGNSPRFANALASVIEQVQGGAEFSAALAEHPRVFPQLYVSLIKASEASGQLAPILHRLADHLQRQREITKRIKGAVTYPIVMCFFAMGVTIFLVTFVLPKFAQIYAGREDKLPTATKWLMAFSGITVDYGLYVLGGVIAAGIGLFFYLRSPKGRLQFDRIKLAMPLTGSLYHKTYLARSLRTLGAMIQSGVSMLESVHLTTKVCDSLHYEQMWNVVNERIERGQQISEALADCSHVPRSVVKMISAGERSGRLGVVMERVAVFCETDLNAKLKTLTGMIEPAIVACLGVVVGGLVLALLLPIFTISRAM